MTAHEERKQVLVLLDEAITAGARQAKACKVLGLSARTVLLKSVQNFPGSWGKER